ncbi:MAG: PDZ domain-containing protein [Oscillatoriales cyanobacterium SM2_2_1]|nr:PDZ domain-containing protein [Oscillatoriales cyanobacterium SM2_2_1]
MAKSGFVLSSTAALAATLALVGLHIANPSIAAFRESPKEVVDEVWQIINRDYVDAKFNQVDWRQLRRQFVESRDYASRAEAYRAVREMLKQLDDPYTRFMDPEQFKSMQIETSGELTGVGITLGMDDETKQLTVIAPLEGSPAAEAGILSRDVITTIAGKTTEGMDLNQAVSLIRGPAGTTVKLGIRRGDKTFELDLKRAKIEIHAVKSEVRDTSVGKIGYIQLRQFNANASSDMRKTIRTQVDQGVTGFVLDLRSNPGGLLYSSAEIARMWLNNATIVSTISRSGENERLTANRQALTDRPLVVLVDNSSASASEILSGALQDNRRAVLVGTQTFGKGLVQSVHSLSDGSGLAVTIAKYYTPNGRDINKSGITPDHVVRLTEKDVQRLNRNRDLIGTTDDPQYAKALEILTKQVREQRTPSASR